MEPRRAIKRWPNKWILPPKTASSHRVSLKLDGTEIPLAGGNAGDEFSPWGVFVSGDFERGDRELPSSTGFDFTTNTLMAGVDYKLDNHWVLGGAISGSQGKADQNSRPDETELSQSALSFSAASTQIIFTWIHWRPTVK